MVFGLPSSATLGAAEVLRTISRAAREDCTVQQVNSLEEWEQAVSTGAPFIALSQYPSPELRSHIEHSAVPAVMILDNPLHAMTHLGSNGQQTDVGAVRAISASFACLSDMLALSESDILLSNTRNLAGFLVRLAEISGITPKLADLQRVETQSHALATRLGIFGQDTLSKPVSGFLSELVVAALPELRDVRNSDRDIRVVWPSSTFLKGDNPDTPMSSPVELAGPSRCVLYGPYLHLLQGHWIARLTLELEGYDGYQNFAVEVVCGDVIGKGRFHCRGVGQFEVLLNFVHRRPHIPLEFRLFLNSGAICGSLTRFDVSLQRSGTDALERKTG